MPGVRLGVTVIKPTIDMTGFIKKESQPTGGQRLYLFPSFG